MDKKFVGVSWLVVTFLVNIALAGDPNATMSIEAIALNGKPINPPQSKITVSPGDIISTRIFIRDFSPNGEKLRAYQATIDYKGYESGDHGKILPKDYLTTTMKAEENHKNGFINTREKGYIHQDLPTVAVVDTISFGYRFLGVLISRRDSVQCQTTGKRFMAGTLNLEVSEDAAGTFILGFDEDPSSTALRSEDNTQILPFDMISLEILVDATGKLLRITSSKPSTDMIIGGNQIYREGIDLIFNTQADSLSPADFVVEDGSKHPPIIQKLTTFGKHVSIKFNKNLRAGRWTQLTHTPSSTNIRVGCVPGDANSNGWADGHDIMDLVDQINNDHPWPLYQADMNGDRHINVLDAMIIIDIINKRERPRLSKP